ncbi:MAG: putative dehydrogenase [bacterium]|jgi:predicted dehydrogenase
MVWLIGAGIMAQDYAKVLLALGTPTTVIGRSEQSAKKFQEKIELEVQIGGLDVWLESKPEIPEAVIVAVNVEQLASVTSQLIDYGIKRILLEKPGGVDQKEILQLNDLATKHSTEVFIAYNRRFYSPVLHAQKMINDDGGVTSFNFEFTEWGHLIEKLDNPKEVMHNWLLANSSHVIDLAFFLGGKPKEISSYTTGTLKWHPSASAFAGAGISESGALFSYQANWAAPGRWGVEVLTGKRRYYFRPMEQLHVQELGSVKVEKVEIDDSLDQQFKPGLYLQTKAFLERQKDFLLTLEEQASKVKIYSKICS